MVETNGSWEFEVQTNYYVAGEHFWGRVPKLPISFEEILSNAYGNFEEQNKVLESSVIIIIY